MLGLETDDTVYLCKESVILAQAYVGAGMEVGTALANQNVAGEDELTISALGAETLGFAVTTVAGGAYALLMSKELQVDVHHRVTPSFLKY